MPLRQRKEIQEMSRSLIVAHALARTTCGSSPISETHSLGGRDLSRAGLQPRSLHINGLRVGFWRACSGELQFAGADLRAEAGSCTLKRAPLLLAFLLIPTLAAAAVWPGQLGAFHRVTDQTVAFQSNQPIWDEYGFREGEEAHYVGDGEQFTARSWRFQDSTGAMAAFEWMRAADSKPSNVARLAAENPTGTTIAHANYVLVFVGYHPAAPFLVSVIQGLKQVDNAPLPSLLDYLPTQDLVPNSERYAEGPAALQQFDPGIPPSTAAFHLSAEAQIGMFHTSSGDLKLAIFSYPTPQIARLQMPQFQAISGAMVKRSGPMVAVILAPPSPDAAEKLLSLIRYRADVTLDERVNTRRDNIGNLVINAFVLIGILLCFAVVGGLAFGSVRAFLRRGGRGEAADAMIVLHLHDRSPSHPPNP